MESIWSKTSQTPVFSPLPGDVSTEVAVIGGGLAGALTAYLLHKKNVETLVIEADRVGSGQTKNTTAKITSQHALIYNRLLQSLGPDRARQYAQANQQAIEQYAQIIAQGQIDCQFEQLPAYVYATGPEDIAAVEQEVRAAQSLGIPAEFTRDTTLPFAVAGAVRFMDQAQFHPLRFLHAIIQELRVYDRTRATTVDGNRIVTDRGTVTAQHIVFATHFPFINVPGFYFARMHQDRSYVLALQGTPELRGMYIGAGADSLSLRSFADVLLLGGGGHRTGENSAGGKYALLRKEASTLYPQCAEIAHWSAQDCMPLDGIPYIGPFAASAPNWYVATGFGKWGMTGSMVAATLLCDQITGAANPCAPVFSPSRFTPSASVKALVQEVAQATKGLGRQVFSLPACQTDALPIGHGGIVEHEGSKVGVYKDERGVVYAVSVRCPHLGCQLEWNPDEKTWDCPCHGSRFDYRGDLIDNPAQAGLQHARQEPGAGPG